ncbi:MAG: response regulator, partial [Rhodospirillales bacterium]|nr:response regulator [Rhodospirillales bacterium]
AAAPPGARPALRALPAPASAIVADGSEGFRLLATLADGRVAMALLGIGHTRWLARPVLARDGVLLALVDGQGAALLTPLRTAHAPAVGAILAAARDRPLGFDRAAAAAFARVAVPGTGWQVVVAERVAAVPLLTRTGLAAPVAMGAFALLAAMALAALLGRMLVRPLGKMAATARAVLAGDEAASVPVLSAAVPRELRLLGRAMNMMLAMLRRRAAETEAALHEARAASAAKSVFLATMSHEIRTPLHGMLGSLELLDAGALEPRQRRYLEGAGQAGRRLARLVDAVFDMAQLEAGRLILAHAPFRLAGLIGALEQEMAPQAAARGLRFTTHLPAHLDIALTGDAARLFQILGNLLDNAVKFTEAGGVTLGVTSLAETAQDISLRFAVADTGIGIGSDRQARLFAPFAPGDASLSRRQDGAGLGLAIAHALAQRMGGALGVDSSHGGGSVFWLMLTLPRAVLAPVGGTQGGGVQAGAQDGGAASDPDAKTDAPRDAAAVLLVEDNAPNRRIAQAMLETLGCRITIAEDGFLAVAAWKQGEFDLIFMDCQMPGMDGLAATRDIRRLEVLGDRPRTPILALTANAEDESREACLEAGMDAVLTKPLTLAGLRAALAAWCMPGAAQAMR